MLKKLSVENYALIDKLDIDFDSGLNIITGETGSGKSILLGALDMILGSRADSSSVRDTTRNCAIEAEFNIEGYQMESLFEQNDIDYQQSCMIRRVINPAGKSRAYINDIPVQLTALKEIGGRLIDIHSQHQTLLIGEGDFQINIVDSVAKSGAEVAKFRVLFAEIKSSRKRLAELIDQAKEAGRELEYITFQFEQLSTAKLIDGEQEQAEALLSELTHASEIKDTMLFASDILDGSEDNILVKLKSIETSVGRLEEFYPAVNELHTRIRGSLLELKDIASEVLLMGERVEANGELLEKTSQRLDTLYLLQQKHGVRSVGELMAVRDNYDQRLNNISGFAEQIEATEKNIEELTVNATAIAATISAARKRAAPLIEKHVQAMLTELGMPSAQIKVEIEAAEFTINGADNVRFLFTANKNTSLQPIDKVASGGEMSRLMLTLKALVANYTQLPTIIFDEIDSGVSGSIADKMGDIIARIAANIQVINITHLPQVASKGDSHLLVYKSDTPQGTQTFIRRLSAEERVDHIASMLSGANVSQAAREQARLLLSRP